MISAGPKDTIISATLGPCCRPEENRGSGVSEVTQSNQTVTKQTVTSVKCNQEKLPLFLCCPCRLTVVTESGLTHHYHIECVISEFSLVMPRTEIKQDTCSCNSQVF